MITIYGCSTAVGAEPDHAAMSVRLSAASAWRKQPDQPMTGRRCEAPAVGSPGHEPYSQRPFQ
jgi:hypothetical protein